MGVVGFCGGGPRVVVGVPRRLGLVTLPSVVLALRFGMDALPDMFGGFTGAYLAFFPPVPAPALPPRPEMAAHVL